MKQFIPLFTRNWALKLLALVLAVLVFHAVRNSETRNWRGDDSGSHMPYAPLTRQQNPNLTYPYSPYKFNNPYGPENITNPYDPYNPALFMKDAGDASQHK